MCDFIKNGNCYVSQTQCNKDEYATKKIGGISRLSKVENWSKNTILWARSKIYMHLVTCNCLNN